ncbi:MAG: class I SAM-dependent methyltransferase [Acetobacteraceae bacterium]
MSNASLSCRSCGHVPILPVLSLGETPLANALLTRDQLAADEARFPLDLAFCPSCTLVQITKSVPPEMMFRDYMYFSSFSDTMLAHARAIAERMTAERGLTAASLVIEIASNDGYLLRNYLRAGVPVLGVEPASNIATVAREQHGIDTIEEFFGTEVSERLAAGGQRADVLHANNVLAHVPDLNGFVGGIATVLKPDGVAVIEAPFLMDMMDNLEFDTIYHEHLCYFSLTALAALFSRHGLTIIDVERHKIHGGSLRLFAARSASGRTPEPSVAGLLDEESRWHVRDYKRYQGFGARVAELKTELIAVLNRLKTEGKTVAAYGASAKGATLLNTFGIGHQFLDYIVDRSTVKQGHFAPGTHLEILSPDVLATRKPDYLLLLAWNFADEILHQQHSYRQAGGRFIIPIPTVTII